MLRFLLAGMVTVGGLVLLFLGSFGDPGATLRNLQSAFPIAQAPVKPAATPSPTPKPVVKEAEVQAALRTDDAVIQRQRDALQQQFLDLQAKVVQAAQETVALRDQAEQARRELDAVRQQRAADQAASERAREEARREAEARQQRVSDVEQQVAAEQAKMDRLKAETQRIEAAQQANRPQPVPPPSTESAPANVIAQSGAADRATVQQTQQRGPQQDVKAAPPALSAAATPSPPQPAPPPPQPAAQAGVKSEPDAREAVLTRLRRQPQSRSNAEQVSSVAPRIAAVEPRVVSPRERLLDARAALAAGRVDQAQQLLQEAQVQLVFRPVSPSQDAPVGGSVAAGQVAEALSMLGAGDVLHAMQYVNLAVAQADHGPAVAAAALPPPRSYYSGQ